MSTEDSVLFVHFSKVEVSHLDGLAGVVGITKSHCVLSEESLQPTRAESDSAFRRRVRLSSRRRLGRVVCVELFMSLFLSCEFFFSSLREHPAIGRTSVEKCSNFLGRSSEIDFTHVGGVKFVYQRHRNLTLCDNLGLRQMNVGVFSFLILLNSLSLDLNCSLDLGFGILEGSGVGVDCLVS